MKRTVTSQTGHTLCVTSIAREDLPEHLDETTSEYTTFYTARNWTNDGPVMLYLGKGHQDAPQQIVAWYRSTGKLWARYGMTLKEAIDGAFRDGYLYA